jgi:hypothetical protein
MYVCTYLDMNVKRVVVLVLQRLPTNVNRQGWERVAVFGMVELGGQTVRTSSSRIVYQLAQNFEQSNNY